MHLGVGVCEYTYISTHIIYLCTDDLIGFLNLHLIYLAQCLTNNRCSVNTCQINQWVFKSSVSSLIITVQVLDVVKWVWDVTDHTLEKPKALKLLCDESKGGGFRKWWPFLQIPLESADCSYVTLVWPMPSVGFNILMHQSAITLALVHCMPITVSNLLSGCPKWGQKILPTGMLQERELSSESNVPRASSLVLG